MAGDQFMVQWQATFSLRAAPFCLVSFVPLVLFCFVLCVLTDWVPQICTRPNRRPLGQRLFVCGFGTDTPHPPEAPTWLAIFISLRLAFCQHNRLIMYNILGRRQGGGGSLCTRGDWPQDNYWICDTIRGQMLNVISYLLAWIFDLPKSCCSFLERYTYTLPLIYHDIKKGFETN